MKKLLAAVISVCMILTAMVVPALADEASYSASAAGLMGDVTVTLTIDGDKLTNVEIDAATETPELGGAAAETMAAAMLATNSIEVDAMSGATITSDAILTAAADALAQSGATLTATEGTAIAFVPGTYEGTASGYNGPVTVSVTFSEDKIEDIQIVSSVETAHVGDIAFDLLPTDIMNLTSTGVDGISGATFSSNALKNAVTAAAVAAGCDETAIRTNGKIELTAGEPIECTYDVVVVGAGGAGMAAAAQATQEGNTVLVIEKNAEIGGNTLVSGGQYQSVMPYLVWDANDPDATTGVYAYTGESYDKVKSVAGCIDELKMILNWNEEPFDAEFYKDNEFVAGDAMELSKHGVHEEYLPVLQALKTEIQAYLDWAQPQLDAGVSENHLTLFSTLNLHIFQTYYGGLRPSADGSEWCYGDVDLVSQFINDGQGLKEWLEDQGATFHEDTQQTLIGALWYRENEFIGANINGTEFPGRWGSYFMAPLSTIQSNETNCILTRTTAESLIVDENGRVIGVQATQFDGTPVTAMATKGVILATGGYAANTDMVLENNIYWSDEYVTPAIKTTNRSSMQGDGVRMAQEVGADTIGLGFTQMMPISWVDNGNLAFGGGNYACWINPTTGHRFVDEGSERDVLSLAEFRNGMEVNGTKGAFLEFYNKEQMMPAPMQLAEGDYNGRYYRRTIAELPELFAELGVTADPEVVIETIRAYDQAVMGNGEFPDCGKAIASRTVGNCELNEDGSYNVDTYDLDNALLTIRLMAPSTHHTMGGVKVDIDRHVLDTEGNAIAGLYAAGEVTGGIHGGNRLGGNAIVEIFVSGRTAAKAVTADNQ